MYQAANDRYEKMAYVRCGKSGLKLPAISLGLWHNFGDTGVYENMKEILFTAFDNGIVHFDLANNYGPAYGSAEKNFGKILKEELGVYRDELLISTKAGFDMWEGPYGNWGSRKYLLSSLDQSLKRMGLDYVDIFYHHRMDPETPLEETMGALASAVQSGKALYVGLSNYDGPTLEKAEAILRDLKCPFVINQNRYSIFDRTIEKKWIERHCEEAGEGNYCIQSTGAGTSHRPLSERNPGRQQNYDGRSFPEEICFDRGKTCEDQRTERTGSRKRSDIGRDGIELDLEGWYCNKRSCRCIKTGTGIG